MIAPEPESADFDLLGTILAVLIVMLGTWIFGQLLGPPLLRFVRMVLA